MTVTIANEDSAYLAALYGGRSITKALAAQVEVAKARLADADDFVEVGADFNYDARTGQLRVVRDDREVDTYLVHKPDNGYWSDEGFRVRNLLASAPAIMFGKANHKSDRLYAEGMFDWPIYRAALRATVGEETFLAGWTARGENDRANTAFAQSVTDIWNANLVVVKDDEDRIAAQAREDGVWPCGHPDGLNYSACPICSVVDPRDAE